MGNYDKSRCAEDIKTIKNMFSLRQQAIKTWESGSKVTINYIFDDNNKEVCFKDDTTKNLKTIDVPMKDKNPKYISENRFIDDYMKHGKILLEKLTDSVKIIVGGEGKNNFKISGSGTFKEISAEDDKDESDETDKKAEKSGKVGWRDYGHGNIFNTDGITLGAVVYQKEDDEKFGFCIKLELYNESRSEDEYNKRLEIIKEKIDKNGEDSLWKELKCENQGTDEKPLWAIKYNIDLLKERPDKEAFDDIVDEMTKGVFILKAFYKYLVSGNNEILGEKIDFFIKSLSCAQEAGIALGPTLITLDDLIFDDNKQIVLTGAPGTGKTYSAQEYVMWQALTEWKKDNKSEDAKKFIKYWKETIPSEPDEATEDPDSKLKKYISDYKRDRFHLVQFHPSYDYTDFVEGLRPIDGKDKDDKDKEGKMKFVKMDGEFKSFCRKAAAPEKKDKKFYFVIDEINRADLSKVFGELMYCLVSAK